MVTVTAAAAQEAPEDLPKPMMATCEALYDFEGVDKDELSFKVGETLQITGELNGWYLGHRANDTVKIIGIFPSNYVRIISEQ